MAGEKEVIVINVENNEEKRFYSLVKASEYFGVSKYVISKHILLKKEKLFKHIKNISQYISGNSHNDLEKIVNDICDEYRLINTGDIKEYYN